MLDDLYKFLSQSDTTNLKTVEYPKEYSGLKMKTSFGQGVPARVSWIGFFTQDMSASGGFFPVYLYYKQYKILILSYGISETSEYPQSWPSDITDSSEKIIDYIPDAPRYGDSYIYKAYSVSSGRIFDKENQDNEIETSELEKDLNTIIDRYKKCLDIKTINSDTYSLTNRQFHIEEELENFIIHNWDNIELSKKYELIYEDGELVSQQYKVNFSTGKSRIDILVRDKVNKNHVVIELKKGQTSDDTVGQVLRYMGWVKNNLKDDNVKGLIIASSFDDKLKSALSMVNGVDVFVYQVDFILKPHE